MCCRSCWWGRSGALRRVAPPRSGPAGPTRSRRGHGHAESNTSRPPCSSAGIRGGRTVDSLALTGDMPAALSSDSTAAGGLVQNRRSNTSRPRATRHQTRHHSQVIRVVSAVACHRVLVSIVPSAAWAINVISELPEAWLNNQAYQKVTATVAVASIGLDPNWGITKKRDVPDGDADGHQHRRSERGAGGLQFRLGPAAEAGLLRQLRVEGVDDVDRDRHREAVPDS